MIRKDIQKAAKRKGEGRGKGMHSSVQGEEKTWRAGECRKEDGRHVL